MTTGLETLKKDAFKTIASLDAMATMGTMTTLGTMSELDAIKTRTLNTLSEIGNIKNQVLETTKILEKLQTCVKEDIQSYEDELSRAKAELADVELHSLDWHHKEPRKLKCKDLEARIEELWRMEKLLQGFSQEELIKA